MHIIHFHEDNTGNSPVTSCSPLSSLNGGPDKLRRKHVMHPVPEVCLKFNSTGCIMVCVGRRKQLCA